VAGDPVVDHIPERARHHKNGWPALMEQGLDAQAAVDLLTILQVFRI
jgi:hypothetical protein